MAANVVGSISKLNRAANCIARIIRKGSSLNDSAYTILRRRCFRSDLPSRGSISSSESSATAMALTVKSRRTRSSSTGRFGSKLTSKSRCPAPMECSVLGSVMSNVEGPSALTWVNLITPKLRPTKSTRPWCRRMPVNRSYGIPVTK